MKWSSLLLLFVLVLGKVNSQTIASCQDVACPSGFRCSQGMCVRQMYQPKKTICSFGGVNLYKCTNRNYYCSGVQLAPTCAYTSQGVKLSFTNDCEPCLDQQIAFYFKGACSEAPPVCSTEEECINGRCVKIFSEKKYQNYKTCSSNSQCRRIIERCIAGKCVKLTELANTLKQSSIQSPY